MKRIPNDINYRYFTSLRRPVREQVQRLMNGADEQSVSSEGLLAYQMLLVIKMAQNAGVIATDLEIGGDDADVVVANGQNQSTTSAEASLGVQDVQTRLQTAPAVIDGRDENVSVTNEMPADTAAPEAAESACETPAATADTAAPTAAESAPAVAEMPAEEVDAVRCQERPEVLLDLEQLQPDELSVLMPQVRREQVDALMPEAEFRRGATVEGVSAELLADEVLDVRPQRSTANDVDARYDEMMERVRRLADSRRCLLFEQVRAVTECDFEDAIFRTVYKQYRTPEKRAHFMALSRSERLHIVARLWIWRSASLKAKRRNGIRQ